MNIIVKVPYDKLETYILSLIDSKEYTELMISILSKAEIPLYTFVTGIKLYKTVTEIVMKRKEYVYKNKKHPDFIFLKNENKILSQNLERYTLKSYEEYISKIAHDINSNKSHNDCVMSWLLQPFVSIMVCIIISSKFYSDISFTNESWCPLIKISHQIINKIEREILELLEYKINTNGDKKIMDEISKITKYDHTVLDFQYYNNIPTEGRAKSTRNFVRKVFCLN